MTTLTAPHQLSFSINEVICICDAWVRLKCKKKKGKQQKRKCKLHMWSHGLFFFLAPYVSVDTSVCYKEKSLLLISFLCDAQAHKRASKPLPCFWSTSSRESSSSPLHRMMLFNFTRLRGRWELLILIGRGWTRRRRPNHNRSGLNVFTPGLLISVLAVFLLKSLGAMPAVSTNFDLWWGSAVFF